MCGTLAEQSILESGAAGGVRSPLVRAKNDHLRKSRLWYAVSVRVCVCVRLFFFINLQRQTPGFKNNAEITLSLGLLFSLPYNAEWGQRLEPEPADCVQREDEGENKQTRRKKKHTGRLLKEEKKGAAVSCGWHPDRLVWVRNGFPEAPERSRQCHYSNATA